MSSPRARAIINPVVEFLSDEVILFDCEAMHYYRMDKHTYALWQRCDGNGSRDELAALVLGTVDEAAIAYVDLAIDELAHIGLLDAPTQPALTMDRRRMAKLVVAGALGGVATPFVAAITAPHSAAALTCTGTWAPSAGCVAGDGPKCSTCCCCATGPTSTAGFCAYDAVACDQHDNFQCI